MPQQWRHRVCIDRLNSEVTSLGVPCKPALPLQKAADPMGDGVRQLREFLTRRRLAPAEPHCPVGPVNVHPVEEQHVEVNIQQQPL